MTRYLFNYPVRLVIALVFFWSVCTATNGEQNTGNFTIVGGQIYTPGLAIVDSPQPFTPEGGDFLQVALDISGDGRLPQPPNNADPLTQIFNITIFLTSYTTLKNFTISNGTGTLPPLAPILAQEAGSTVKHVNFEWPDCLTGDGDSTGGNNSRGDYNISIHQNYRLNGTNFYTIFALPIQVTNGIVPFPPSTQILVKPIPGPVNSNGGRVACALLENPLLTDAELVASVNNPSVQPYIGGTVSISGTNSQGGGGEGGGGGTVGGQGQGGGGTIGNSNNNGNGQTFSQGEIGNSGTRGRPALGWTTAAIGIAMLLGATGWTAA
ncbi:hypothetical protein AOQ84DRAFT_390273 [Glonium stellatum]|uniref:Uncharacterized protein n=1 Tax=Glonium stellatum TaxID=574774 RepID=A0A8E2EWQ0_9PEZI|nr:hypothetical protein AOQ84DRAFT_390273 [Glonium stellatum]